MCKQNNTIQKDLKAQVTTNNNFLSYILRWITLKRGYIAKEGIRRAVVVNHANLPYYKYHIQEIDPMKLNKTKLQ